MNVDVHILTLPDTNQYWLQRCLASLECEPVNVHICEGIKGDIGLARTKSFQHGSSEFVSFVDPDDEVISGTFRKLVDSLEKDYGSVMAYSDEVLIDENGIPICYGWSKDPNVFSGYDTEIHRIGKKHIHHLRVIRRRALNKCLPLKSKMMPEPVLMHELSLYGKFIHVEEIGYKWRIHGKNIFKTYTKEDIESSLEAIKGLRP